MSLHPSTPVASAVAAGPSLVFRPSPVTPLPIDGPVTPPPIEGGAASVPRSAETGPGVGVEVYRRRRLVALAVALGLVLGLMSFGRQAGANRTPEAEAATAVTVVVQPGDTLWGIARSLAPGADPRPLADALSDLVGGTSLQPGQRIVVPADLLG